MVKAKNVYLKLPVSFFIVNNVVIQGKCMTEKIITHKAVLMVQPLSINNVFNSPIFFISVIYPSDIYPIIIIGMTISFAGSASKKAISITPSNPIVLANGSRKFVHKFKIEVSLILMLASTHIIRPAGADMTMALFKIDRLLLDIDFTIVLKIWGLLYGGSSKVKELTVPFKIVLDSNLDIRNVNTTPTKMKIVKAKELNIELEIINMEIMEINRGKRPLHGMKELVKMAINLSRGESIILAPVTPTALQPKPKAIVRAPLPHDPHF